MGKKGATPRKGRTCAWYRCKRTGVVQIYGVMYCKEHAAQSQPRLEGLEKL